MQRKAARKQKHRSKYICYKSKQQEESAVDRKKEQLASRKEEEAWRVGRIDWYEIGVHYSLNRS